MHKIGKLTNSGSMGYVLLPFHFFWAYSPSNTAAGVIRGPMFKLVTLASQVPPHKHPGKFLGLRKQSILKSIAASRTNC